MADTNTETHADIIAEMRERCIDEQHSPTLWPYFDRLEAAHRRELAEKDSVIQTYVAELGSERERHRREVAQLRETLGEIVLLTLKVGMSMNAAVATGIIASKAKHALAATKTKGENQ